MKYSTLFFDLDGTLTDSAEGIYNSVAFALEKLGHPVSDKTTLKPFLGPPLTESFRDICGFDEETTLLGVKYYREYYPQKGIFENKLYKGIPELLKKLSENGIKIALATSKPELFAVRIMEHFGIDRYFDVMIGSTLDTSRQIKSDVLRYAVEKVGLRDLSQGLMIGDRKHDILGAHEVGIPCAAVLYGYGSREEFEKYNADYIIADIDELERFLLDEN
ncbi:MAG: HAD family hydrolase [Clostridia bacterium]|nr:HAD family hydrolase [Clostridia bacterium]